MSTYDLKEDDWENIAALAFDQNVLQLGYDQYPLAVNLARVAHHVTVVGTPLSHDPATEEMRLTNLRNTLFTSGVYRHATVCGSPWMDCLGMFLRQQFDLAVVDPAALGWDLIETILVPVLDQATNVVMVEPPGWNSWQAVARVCPEQYFSIDREGRLIVVRRIFGSDADEQGGQ
jgi:hypothetical protein